MPDQPLYQSLYERDYYAWTLAQAAALRRLAAARSNVDLDLENLAEEVEGLAGSYRHAVESHTERVIEHFLKLAYSPAPEPRIGWCETITLHRTEWQRKITGTLRNHLAATLPQRYRAGRRLAALGIARDGIAEEVLPMECPYALEQIEGFEWWPQNRHRLALPAGVTTPDD